MNKKTAAVIGLLLLLFGSVFFIYYDSCHWALTDYEINYYDIESEKVPDSFNDVSIMLLSDIEFGSFFNADRLDKLSEKLSNVNCDIVLFSGDLFDSLYIVNGEDITAVTAFLKRINCKLGKFAILGDFDMVDSEREAVVRSILFNADFEIIDNSSISLYNDSYQYITLSAMNYSTEDYSTNIMHQLNTDTFNLALIHGSRTFESFPNDLIDLTLCGHSHHMQVNYPIFGSYRSFENNGNYKNGKHQFGSSILYISNGIGTTGIDYRLFSDPEIAVFRLKRSEN